MNYKHVIFDFDGTLADSFPWFMRVFNNVADKYRFKRIEAHEVETLRGLDAASLMKYLQMPMWKMPLVTRHIRKRMNQDLEQISLFQGVSEMLRRLNENRVILSIVTSNARMNVEQVLGAENSSLIKYYECGASLFGKQKKIRKVLRQSGVPRNETILIGDEIRDLEAAHAEEIAFGAVAWGYTNPSAFKKYSPEETFESVDDLIKTIL